MAVIKKAVFFTIDALLAASILLGGILLLSAHYVNEQPTAHLNYLSQDIINCLSTLKVNELNSSYIDGLIADGNITNVNNSILQQVGEFWAAENFDTASEFMDNVTKNIIPDRYGFGIWVNNELIYQRDQPPPRSRAVAMRLISGIEKKKPIEGFMSKARANNFIKSSTEIISFSPEGAGWDGSFDDPGEAVIDKYFELPNNMNITDAVFYISLHIEDSGPSWEVININNGTCSIARDDINFIGGEGTFDKKDISGCITTGMNNVRLRLRNIGYNGHIHPGMLIKINYTMNDTIPEYDNTFSKRYYFDNIVSNEGNDEKAGAWGIVPFFIPENTTDVSVRIHIEGRNIRDYTSWWGWFSSWSGFRSMRDYDYILFVNEDYPFDSDNSPESNPVYDYTPAELADEIIEGTNVVSVYFNNYGDYEWGDAMPQIYSDQVSNPENSSYVEVNYTFTETKPYGSIKITKVEEFGGSADWEKETSFSFPQQAVEMGDVFTHIVQQYSYLVDVEADIYTPPANTVFSSPSARTVPTTVFIPGDVLDLSPSANNYIRVSDRNRNDILPDTSVEYSFYLPSFVGYGDVFLTQEEAEADALERLNQTLGEFISAENIVVESSEITDVPTMWGPAVIKVRAWH